MIDPATSSAPLLRTLSPLLHALERDVRGWLDGERRTPISIITRAELEGMTNDLGRQADALDVYTDARRRLVDELALEPGPELQRLQQGILAHDRELAAPQRPASGRRRPRMLAGAVAALTLVVAALGVAVATSGRGGTEPLSVAAPGRGIVFALDASTGHIRRRVPLGRAPTAIAAEGGVVWVVDADARTVSRLAGSSRVIDVVSTGATPLDLCGRVGLPVGRERTPSQ